MTFVECEKIGNSQSSFSLQVFNFMGKPFTAIASPNELRECDNKLYVSVRSVTPTRNNTAIVEVDDQGCRRKIIVPVKSLRDFEI